MPFSMRDYFSLFLQDRDHWRGLSNEESIRCSRLRDENTVLIAKLQMMNSKRVEEATSFVLGGDDDGGVRGVKGLSRPTAAGLSGEGLETHPSADVEMGDFKLYDAPELNHRTTRTSLMKRTFGTKQQRIDPYIQYRIGDKLRRLKDLGNVERRLVLWGSAILATRFTRVGLLCYLSLLHVLVFVSIHFHSSNAILSSS